MVLAFQKGAFLALLLVLLAMSTLVRSQAPNDASESCDKQAVPDGVFMLLDTYWYRVLLPSETSTSAGWTQTPESSWAGQGNLCARSVVSCDSSTIGWLVTQYISKSADVSYPLEITVAINGNTGSSCSSCTSNAIKAYYYPRNGPITSGEQLNTNNYNLIGSITFNPTAATKSVTFPLGSEYDRFYIAIVAESVCFTLRRLQVSYSVCPEDTDGLVVYPNTPIGSSPETSTASCKENAQASPGTSLSITCNSDGSYSGTPSCSCSDGYFLSGSTCFACAPGTYSDGSICLDCPENSDSTEVASAVCACNEGFVRLTDKPSDPCVECAPGTYSDGSICLDCPENSNSTEVASTVCACNEGFVRLTNKPSDPCVDADSVTSPTTDTGTNIVGSLWVTTITALLLTAFLLRG